MKLQTVLIFAILILNGSCGENEKPKKNEDVIKEMPNNYSKLYRNTVQFEISQDTMLRQSFKAIKYDSIKAYDYIGFSGEHTFSVINDDGYLIDSSRIKKQLTLSSEQAKRITKTLGDIKTYEGTSGVGCYEPRLAFVYFLNNKVVGQVMICLGCMKLESTILLPNKEKYVSLGDIGRRRFSKFCSELEFSECNHWGDKF